MSLIKEKGGTTVAETENKRRGRIEQSMQYSDRGEQNMIECAKVKYSKLLA